MGADEAFAERWHRRLMEFTLLQMALLRMITYGMTLFLWWLAGAMTDGLACGREYFSREAWTGSMSLL